VKRFLGRLVIGLIAALSVLYVGDWAVWRARVAMGGGMGTVTVNTIVVLPLKDNKNEYDEGGIATLPCSLSLFPQGSGAGACWWLRRHSAVFEQ
jgi:hypothetical protein